ncbi:MAG TPA: protein kinase [Elusimicrobiota bacterium]|nr:protein kinase [Elusimicrobiota bacterium]
MIAPLRSAAFLILLFSVSIPTFADQDDTITFSELSQKTFKGLMSGAKDQKKIDAVNLTQTIFNQLAQGKVPEDARYDSKDVVRVGKIIGDVLDVVANYQDQIKNAHTSQDVAAAKNQLSLGVESIRSVGSIMPVQHPESPAQSPATKSDSQENAAEKNPEKNASQPGGAIDLGQIAREAANQASQKIKGIGDGGTQVPGGGSLPGGGTGASANGATPGSDGGGQTTGQILGADDPNNPNDVMADAREKYRDGDVAGGLADASRAVDLGGGAEALALRGGMQLDQKQYSQAVADARDALEKDPSNQEAQAVLHFAEGRTDGIDSGALPAQAAGSAPGGGGSSAGDGSQSAGGVAGGLAALSGSIRSSGGAGAGAALSGMTREQARNSAQDALGMGDLGGAMAFVNQALKENPRDPELLNLRSSIYARQHDYANAIGDAKAGLEISPRDPALLRSLGFAQLREKDYDGAMATANEMLELNPNDPYAYAIRGHAYGSMGDRDAMMSDLKRAAELDPEFAPAAAKMAGELQLPQDKDILFLFPGEESASAAKPAAPAAARGRSFGMLVGASVLGGLLLALGLLKTVMAPLKEKLTSAFTRITRTGPTVAPIEEETARPASINGLMPGLIRGQYELSRQIGAGGMGLVYAGIDRSLGRPVAVKKMRDELRFDPREKARFVAEAKTVAALHHPNIVDIYSIAEEGDDVFLVFEYVDGKTVHELLQGGGKLAPERAAAIVRASAGALEYAHSRGVIHRDMKPSNVMLDQAGRVKVMDFGIARMAKDTMLRQSMTNTVVGTPPYMAPEQEQGHVRKESDVYSLAICAYEMLTGKLPFVGIGAGMLMNKINMSYVPPSRENAGLPPALDAVFERAFQSDPEKRWRSPGEFAAALEAALPAAVRTA